VKVGDTVKVVKSNYKPIDGGCWVGEEGVVVGFNANGDPPVNVTLNGGSNVNFDRDELTVTKEANPC
jgi:hypothetical protein